jgi:hypothetical protein
MLRDQLPTMNAPQELEANGLPSPAPLPSEPAPLPVQLAVPNEKQAPPILAAPPSQAEARQDVVPLEEPDRKARRQGKRSTDDADDEGGRGPMPGMLFGSFEDDPENVPFQGPRMEDLEDEREQAASKRAPAIGEDLRELRKDNRRKLDLEDPFQ